MGCGDLNLDPQAFTCSPISPAQYLYFNRAKEDFFIEVEALHGENETTEARAFDGFKVAGVGLQYAS